MDRLNTEIINSTKYSINIDNDDECKEEIIKKVFRENGLHIYKVNENKSWVHGNKDGKITFEMRKLKNVASNISEAKEKLEMLGLKLEKYKDSKRKSTYVVF